MLTEVLLGILLVALLFAFVNRKPPNLPPGKWGWPVVGCLPSDDVSLGEQVMELRKKHGDIISWRMGSRIFIFFCDLKIIKAAFSKMEFSDRPDFYSFDVFSNFIKAGLSNINGQLWVNNRTFALRHLKQLGMGKSYLEEAVQYEAACMVKDFKKHTNKVGRLPCSLSVAILNVIWQMAANQRFDVDDPEMQRFSKVIRSLFDDFQGPVVWFDLMPWLIPITPTFVKRWMGIEQLQEKLQEIFEYMDNSIKEHQAKLDPQNPKDYIDAYLLEMEEQKNNPESTMNLFDLKICMVDLFTAGSETTSATIRWALFLLAKHPEMQAKVQKEIDSVFPRDVLPSVQQRNSLPYLEAISLEVHRYASIARLGFLHYCNKDTEFMGYTIPKGAVLSQHHECCHTDPAYWEKPNEFYPEHFLDAEGNLLTKKEGFMPFSLGRRQCPGEPLVRMELFVFLSALLQNFVFSVPKGVELLLEKNAHDSFLNMPKDLEIMITERP